MADLEDFKAEANLKPQPQIDACAVKKIKQISEEEFQDILKHWGKDHKDFILPPEDSEKWCYWCMKGTHEQCPYPKSLCACPHHFMNTDVPRRLKASSGEPTEASEEFDEDEDWSDALALIDQVSWFFKALLEVESLAPDTELEAVKLAESLRQFVARFEPEEI